MDVVQGVNQSTDFGHIPQGCLTSCSRLEVENFYSSATRAHINTLSS